MNFFESLDWMTFAFESTLPKDKEVVFKLYTFKSRHTFGCLRNWTMFSKIIIILASWRRITGVWEKNQRFRWNHFVAGEAKSKAVTLTCQCHGSSQEQSQTRAQVFWLWLMLIILNVLNYLILKEMCQGYKQTINLFNLLTNLFLRTYTEQGTMLNIVGEQKCSDVSSMDF